MEDLLVFTGFKSENEIVPHNIAIFIEEYMPTFTTSDIYRMAKEQIQSYDDDEFKKAVYDAKLPYSLLSEEAKLIKDYDELRKYILALLPSSYFILVKQFDVRETKGMRYFSICNRIITKIVRIVTEYLETAVSYKRIPDYMTEMLYNERSMSKTPSAAARQNLALELKKYLVEVYIYYTRFINRPAMFNAVNDRIINYYNNTLVSFRFAICNKYKFANIVIKNIESNFNECITDIPIDNLELFMDVYPQQEINAIISQIDTKKYHILMKIAHDNSISQEMNTKFAKLHCGMK
jgi:hypothetical protein